MEEKSSNYKRTLVGRGKSSCYLQGWPRNWTRYSRETPSPTGQRWTRTGSCTLGTLRQARWPLSHVAIARPFNEKAVAKCYKGGAGDRCMRNKSFKNCGNEIKWRNDPRSCERNLCNYERSLKKNSRLQRGMKTWRRAVTFCRNCYVFLFMALFLLFSAICFFCFLTWVTGCWTKQTRYPTFSLWRRWWRPVCSHGNTLSFTTIHWRKIIYQCFYWFLEHKTSIGLGSISSSYIFLNKAKKKKTEGKVVVVFFNSYLLVLVLKWARRARMTFKTR